MIKRLWKFNVETNDGEGWLLIDGKMVHDKAEAPGWTGTDAEASLEAERRCNAAETSSGILITRVTYESQGRVKPSAKTGQEEMPF